MNANDDKLVIKNWDRASPIGPDILEVYGSACFFGGVASPMSIKARSSLYNSSAIEQY